MMKNEHYLFQDIPSAGQNGTYHSAVLTTYAIDIIHFDNNVRNTLHRKQVTSINILADSEQIDKTLEFVSPSFIPHVGKDYSVTSVIMKNGVFHPKVNFFIGYDSVLVLIGTGNLTVAGHGKNHEMFTGFMIDANNMEHRPLIEECWLYIKSFVCKAGEFEKQRILRDIPDNCRFLEDDYKFVPHAMHYVAEDLQAALMYNEKGRSILSQIANIVPMNDVLSITIASPFFDEDGLTLLNIKALCPNAQMDVLIQKDCLIPPCKMEEMSDILFYDFDKTQRGKSKIKGYDRLAHAKVYVFKTHDMEYCVVGSANATKAGLGTMGRRGTNEELCVLYASTKKNFLHELGLTPSKRCYIPRKQTTPQQSTNVQETSKPIHISYASYEDNLLKVFITDSVIEDNFSIIVEDGINMTCFDNIHINDNTITVNAILEKCSSLCYAKDINGILISNKVFINRLDMLDTTNPSPKTRALNRIIYKIDSDGYNGLEMANLLTEVMWDMMDDTNQKKSTIAYSYNNTISKKNDKLPQIKYHADYDNDNAHSSHTHRKSNASRLIESIEESIKKKLKTFDEDLKDEEEEGNADVSCQRANEPSYTKKIPANSVSQCANKALAILKCYKTLISRRSEICEKGNNDIQKEDFHFFTLSMFAAMEICYLSRFMYDFDLPNRMEKSIYQKKLYDSLDQVMECDGLNVLVSFSSFCKRCDKHTKYDVDEKSVQKAMKYAILFVVFYYRFTPYNKINEKKISTAFNELVKMFGLPGIEQLEKELNPLAKTYNYIFKFKDIEQRIKKLGYNW